MKSKCVLPAFGLVIAVAFAQPTPKENEERPRAEVFAQEWLGRSCTDACCLVAGVGGQLLYQERERSRADVYALEGLGALGGTASCVSGGGGVALVCFMAGAGDSPLVPASVAEPAFLAVAVVSAVALPAATGYGTAKAGEKLGEKGSAGWAIGGAYASGVCGAGVALLGRAVSQSDAVRIPAYVLGGLCLPAGAVVGYNLGIKREAGPHQPGLGSRLELPGVALTSVDMPDHSVEYGVKVQLAGLRF